MFVLYNAYQDTRIGIGGLSVVSCGHIFARKGRKIDRPAGRTNYLLFYVAKGKEHFFIDREVIAEEGAFVFFRPYEKQQHIYLENATGEFYYVHFEAPADFDLFGFESSVVYHSKPSTTICHIFEEIISELQKKQPAYERFCASKVYTLMAILERKTKKELSPQGKHLDKVSYVIQNMNMEYQINYTLEEYAKMCNISKFHFLRVFKDITGVSPLEYRNNIRLNHVKEQLKDTDVPLCEIAENAGYTSPSYFCEAFKKKFGMSPSQYRKTAEQKRLPITK